GGRAQASAQVGRGLARRRRAEVVVDVRGGEPLLAFVRQRQAVRQERALALLLARERRVRIHRLGWWLEPARPAPVPAAARARPTRAEAIAARRPAGVAARH